MREIKFRAWDGIELVYECGVCPTDNIAYRIPDDGSINAENFDYYADYPAMQYTGLKDKNDVEIYEGDIVEYSNYSRDIINEVREVKFNVYNGFFGGRWYDLSDGDVFVKVVGNIYENPELLK